MSAPVAGAGLGAVGAVALERPALERPRASGPDFGQTLADAIDGARAQERTATRAAEGFAAGDPSVGIHEVVIASEKANVSLRYAVTLKNKLIEAYRELMNTPV